MYITLLKYLKIAGLSVISGVEASGFGALRSSLQYDHAFII